MLDDRLDSIEAEFTEVEARLSSPEVSSDPNLLRELSKRHKELSEIVDAYRRLKAARDDAATATSLLEEADPEERDELRREHEVASEQILAIEEELQALLLPKDPNDGRNVIVEIRGAEGGEEANLFARDLFDMYLRYAQRRGWKFEVMQEADSEQGGLDEVVFVVKGKDAWTRLEHEAGPHRVQRVPTTEAKGRIHTSAATVTVLPEAEEVDFEINEADLKIDTMRSSGAGGQHVNKTESAIRITHLPTGVVVAMQEERSQHRNRAKAMALLRSRILDAKQQRANDERAQERREQVGSGDRSQRIRTYNFPQGRMTDHRINLTLYSLDRLIEGEGLDEVIDALTAERQARLLAEQTQG